VETIDQGREMIRETFRNGSALSKFHDMIIGQGVSPTVAKQLVSNDETKVQSILKLGSVFHQANSRESGFVQSIDSFKLGTIVQRLGLFTCFIDGPQLEFFYRWWPFEIH
jgi:thymidine phosphorylase